MIKFSYFVLSCILTLTAADEICHSEYDGFQVELVLLQDATGSYSTFVKTINKAFPDIMNAITAKYSKSRFGITSFKDYVDPKPTCYQTHIGLSTDQTAVLNALAKISVGGGGDPPEMQMAGILSTLTDDGIHWTKYDVTPDNLRVVRVVAITTDIDSKLEGNRSYLPRNLGNPGDNCYDNDAPSLDTAAKILAKTGTSMLGLIATASSYDIWQGYFDTFAEQGVTTVLQRLDLNVNVNEIVEKLLEGLNKVVCYTTTTTSTTPTTTIPTTTTTTTTSSEDDSDTLPIIIGAAAAAGVAGAAAVGVGVYMLRPAAGPGAPIMEGVFDDSGFPEMYDSDNLDAIADISGQEFS